MTGESASLLAGSERTSSYLRKSRNIPPTFLPFLFTDAQSRRLIPRLSLFSITSSSVESSNLATKELRTPNKEYSNGMGKRGLAWLGKPLSMTYRSYRSFHSIYFFSHLTTCVFELNVYIDLGLSNTRLLRIEMQLE